MKRQIMKKQAQSGVFLLEAMIAILIFSLGILGMVAMGGTAIAAQSDAQFRTDAANFAAEIAAKIAINVDRTNATQYVASLQSFAYLPIGAGYCTFTGSASSNPIVTDPGGWVDRVTGAVTGVAGLPGADATHESIAIDTSGGVTGFNQATITVCWKPPSTSFNPISPWRRYVLVTYING